MYHLTCGAGPDFVQDGPLRKAYAGKRVLVLGGDGFLGSHVASALALLGAEVAIISRRLSSPFDRTAVQVHRGHLLQRSVVEAALLDREIVFDLAGSTGAVESNRDPRRNLAEECEPHLNAFQIAAELPTPPLMVFCSTRTVYGKVLQLPVAETHRVAPESFYAIHKLTLEHYLRTFRASHGLDHLIFRLSNPYGPNLEPARRTYGILNQFILRAIRGEPIRLFGDGSQRRDYVYIDDVVEVFLRAAVNPACRGEVFNLGGPAAISIREAVGVILGECPGSIVSHEPWPVDHYAIETGDYVTDMGKLGRLVGRLPHVTFRDGVRRTLEVYRTLGTVVAGRPAAPARVEDGAPPEPAPTPAQAWGWSGRRVLVTGASGFVGRQLVGRLLALGATVGGVHRRPMDPPPGPGPGWVPIGIGLQDTVGLHRQVADFAPTVIFHLAARPDGAELADHAAAGADTNLISTVNLLEVSRRLPLDAFVFAGSSKVYGGSPVPHREGSPTDPLSSYAVSKLAAWNYCRFFARIHDLAVITLHPTLIYGPAAGANLFSYLARCLLAGQTEIELDGGTQTRDPLFLEDAIDAYLLAATRARDLKGRAIPIGGGHEYTVKDLAERFIRAAGYVTPVRACDQRIRPTEIMRSYCENSDAGAALSWRPGTPLDEGLLATARFLIPSPHAQG